MRQWDDDSSRTRVSQWNWAWTECGFWMCLIWRFIESDTKKTERRCNDLRSSKIDLCHSPATHERRVEMSPCVADIYSIKNTTHGSLIENQRVIIDVVCVVYLLQTPNHQPPDIIIIFTFRTIPCGVAPLDLTTNCMCHISDKQELIFTPICARDIPTLYIFAMPNRHNELVCLPESDFTNIHIISHTRSSSALLEEGSERERATKKEETRNFLHTRLITQWKKFYASQLNVCMMHRRAARSSQIRRDDDDDALASERREEKEESWKRENSIPILTLKACYQTLRNFKSNLM